MKSEQLAFQIFALFETITMGEGDYMMSDITNDLKM